MAEVYRIVLPDGQEFAWHGTVEAMKETHPGAEITGRLVMDEVAQGSWEPFNNRKAARAASDEAKVEDKPAAAAKVDEKKAAADATPVAIGIEAKDDKKADAAKK